jgi:plasmid maintenance system antidote protein VapI
MKYKLGDCRLVSVLAERGWTQQDLADYVPIPRQQISDFATNRRKMSLTNAISIAKTIGCSVFDLYVMVPANKGAQSKR